MSAYLYSYSPLLPDDPEDPPVQPHRPPKNSAYVATLLSGDDVYLLPVEDPAAVLAGHWDRDGTLHFVDQATYLELRSLGNFPDGTATDALWLTHFQGHQQSHLQAAPAVDTMPEYPSNVQPIIATLSRRYDDTPGLEGSGWQYTLEFSDPNREPTNRAIGIYSDPECTQYLFTTGQLNLTDTGEVDEDDNPVMKYMTFNPAGKATAEPEDIFAALLHGASQEGYVNLLADSEETVKHFWEESQ